ncbi:MAG: helix-turn-helix domain-containing protein [Butyrivibrio sp.]|nr:helix-turn-helix domain-containing protein [Butyrivibrio sp.]
MSQKIKIDKHFGDNIRTLRKESNLTQEQVVAKLQLMGFETSRSAYSQMECGTYNIRASELTALKEIFNTTFERFFE